eukprot:scaffold25103_cov118-Skeletonema_dohrnii-CCMP3373.AAC.2
MSSQSIPLSADPLIVSLFGLTGLHFFAPEEESNGSGSGDEVDDGHAQCNQIDNGSLAAALLQQKIANISSVIDAHENDIDIIRSKLALAYQELESATKELEALQQPKHPEANDNRGLQSLQQTNGQLSLVFASSLRSQLSSSSDGLNFMTPACSIDEGDGDFYSLLSNASSDSSDSLDSLPSLNEGNKNANRSYIDMDDTPLRSNAVKSSYGNDSIETPSTAASTHAGLEDGRQLFRRQQSYIRSHDLSSFNRGNTTSLIPLSEEGPGVSDVVNALFEIGLESAMDNSDRWVPERTTAKILNQRPQKLDNDGHSIGPMGPWPNAACGDEVLVWTAQCGHDGYGSEYPMVRARGLLPTSARDMIDLLLDSERVKEYNKMSLGRENEHFFSKGVHNPSKCPKTNIHGEAKIVRSRSQPPVVRKPVELRLFLHARRLDSENDDEGSKYLTIARSVWENEDGTADAQAAEATRCEMLLSVNLIRDVSYRGEKWCEITSLTHGVSPGIPIFIARKAALMAAEKYIRDIRSVFEK